MVEAGVWIGGEAHWHGAGWHGASSAIGRDVRSNRAAECRGIATGEALRESRAPSVVSLGPAVGKSRIHEESFPEGRRDGVRPV